MYMMKINDSSIVLMSSSPPDSDELSDCVCMCCCACSIPGDMNISGAYKTVLRSEKERVYFPEAHACR